MNVLDEEQRGRGILAGLFLAKFDTAGLRKLSFGGFAEAFNVLGYALGLKPASIKNYRDEFDPMFPNGRKGWRKRAGRKYCLEYYEKYRDLDIDEFSQLITSFILGSEKMPEIEESDGGIAHTGFAQRLATGLAAEKYFEAVQPSVPDFSAFAVENTTRVGCGYDYKLVDKKTDAWVAVEVKGILLRKGSVSLTELEHKVAARMAGDYFLFVVKNFHETPCHSIYRNPLDIDLQFVRKERMVVQVSWTAKV